MKRLYLGIIITFTTLILFVNANADKINAAETEEFTVLNRGNDEIVIDAQFDEWELHENILVMGEDTWEAFQGGTWDNEEDLTAELRVLYDTENLYFALEVMDDEYVAEGANPWDNDGIQMAIDASVDEFPPPPGLNGTTTQLYNFSIVNGWQTEAGSYLGEAEIKMERDKTAKKNLFEWKMPTEIFADEGTELEAGMKVAFAIIANDSDENDKKKKGWVGWGNNTIVHGKNTEEMKALVLSDKTMPVDVHGKLSSIWGKLKQ